MTEARDTLGFLVYAIEGFVDGIREVIDMVRNQQVQIAWINYVHEVFHDEPNSKASDRQRDLVLALPMWEDIRRVDLTGLTTKIARLYATAGPRTLYARSEPSRDPRSYRPPGQCDPSEGRQGLGFHATHGQPGVAANTNRDATDIILEMGGNGTWIRAGGWEWRYPAESPKARRGDHSDDANSRFRGRYRLDLACRPSNGSLEPMGRLWLDPG